MYAFCLIRNGAPQVAFEKRELPEPELEAGEVLIGVEAFGLNYADVMARLGLYQDCPPLPAVIGYDVVGTIEKVGSGVKERKPGERVTAMTRFGGYAQLAKTDERACAVVPAGMDAGKALALCTQYGTAYYAAEEMARIHEGDHVLIHAAAGGVGTALIQLARRRGAVIYGTAGSDEKLDYLREQGVHHPINYRKEDFSDAVKRINGERGLDLVFDPIGGKSVKKGFKLLGSGGRILLYGGADMTDLGLLGKLQFAAGFGIWHPIEFLMNSKAMIGINMLRIADNRPDALARVLKAVVKLTEAGELDPTVGKIYGSNELAEAHEFLASRKSIGKIAVKWED